MTHFSACRPGAPALQAVLCIATLFVGFSAAKDAFSVRVRDGVQGSDLEILWRDYGLNLERPRNIYRAANNYLIVMSHRKAGRLMQDERIMAVTEVTEYQSNERAGNSPRSIDHWFRTLCPIAKHVNTTLRSLTRNELLDESVLVTVATSRLYDPRGPSTQNLKRRLELFYKQSLNETIAIESDSDRMLRIRILQKDTCSVYSRLLRDKEVILIEKSQRMTAFSNYASAMGQSGSKSVITDSDALIWRQGLMGQGHVVGLGDTGIDVDSCFFREATKATPELSGCDLSRHKIVCYFTAPSAVYGDTATAFGGGHGTLVAGILAGLFTGLPEGVSSGNDWNISYSDVISDSLVPNGMAPLARIALNDIGNAQGQLTTPTDFSSSSYFVDPYNQAQVRVHSNSWGCESKAGQARGCNGYTSDTRSIDEFVWNNKDFLVFFAAGNSGGVPDVDSTTYLNGYYTVVAPSTAKNALSVGATYNNGPFNHDCGALQRPCTSDDLMQDSSRGPTFDGRIKPDLVFPGESILGPFSSGNTTDFSDGATCSIRVLPTATARLSGTSFSCPGVAGHALLVRQYYLEINPLTGLGVSDGNPGPLSDGNGPSAALVKATLINSARSLKGRFSYNSQRTMLQGKISEAPNPRYVEGFGIPNLSNVLVFNSTRTQSNISSRKSSNDSPKNPTLIIFDRQALKAREPPHVFTFLVKAGGSFKATLVYTDPPGPVRAPFDTAPVLVNNLDLIASCVNNTASTCPKELQNTTLWSSISPLDNVEQVPSTSNDPWTFSTDVGIKLQVLPVSISVGTQPYSLVVSGFSIAQDAARSTSPNWVPDWTSTANKESAISLRRDRALLAGLIAGGVFLLILVISAVWGFVHRKREQNDGGSVPST